MPGHGQQPDLLVDDLALSSAGYIGPAIPWYPRPFLFNSLEGIASGTTVTQANSGLASGDAFDGTVSSGTLTADSTYAAHGANSLHVKTAGASTFSYAWWSTSLSLAGTTGKIWFRYYMYLAANPAADDIVLAHCSDSGHATIIAFMRVLATGKLRVFNAASGTVLTTTNTVPLNQWFRVEGFIATNGSNSGGQYELKLFSTADSVTPTETQTSAATQNFGTTVAWSTMFGTDTSTASTIEFWMDDLAVSTDGYQGPAAATGTVTFAGAGSATVHAGSGSASQAVTAAGSAAGTRSQSGAVTAPATLADSAAGAKNGTGAPAQAVTAAGSATGAKKDTGSTSQAVSAAGSAAGSKHVTAAVTAAVSLADSAAGAKKATGAAARAVTLGEAAAGTHRSAGPPPALPRSARRRPEAGSLPGPSPPP